MIVPATRICKDCSNSKSIEEFSKNSGGKDGRRPICGSCEYKRSINYRERNRNKISGWRRSIKAQAVAHFGGKCIICGYDRCLRSLTFHHINPKEKEFSISRLFKSWKKTLPELEKCALVCSNCHGEIHDGLISLQQVLQATTNVAHTLILV